MINLWILQFRTMSLEIWFLFGYPDPSFPYSLSHLKKLRTPQILKFVPRKRFCTFFSSCLSFLAFCLCIGIFWKRMKIKCIVLFDPKVNHNLISDFWFQLSYLSYISKWSHLSQKSHFTSEQMRHFW